MCWSLQAAKFPPFHSVFIALNSAFSYKAIPLWACSPGVCSSSFTVTFRPNPKCIQHLRTGASTSGKGLAIKNADGRFAKVLPSARGGWALLSKKIRCFGFFRLFLAPGTGGSADAQWAQGASLHHPCQPMVQLFPLWERNVVKYTGMRMHRKKSGKNGEQEEQENKAEVLWALLLHR